MTESIMSLMVRITGMARILISAGTVARKSSTKKRKIKELRMRQIKNALVFVFLSAGTPLILAGNEFRISQNGNNNPYCVDSELSWVNWKETKEGKEITEWTKVLIQFRQNNKILLCRSRLL